MKNSIKTVIAAFFILISTQVTYSKTLVFEQEAPERTVTNQKLLFQQKSFEGFDMYPQLHIPSSLIDGLVEKFETEEDGYLGAEALDFYQHKIKDIELRGRGIRELIGVGVSDFTGSEGDRIHNIQKTISLYDGIIIDPGKTFSFNRNLGPVTEEAGFKKTKIILNKKNSEGVGGGVCQVSTNVFRAALNTGLPITERRAHSFALDYYEPYGLDATIYKWQQDLQFVNDTPGKILIKFKIQDEKLITLVYGTNDGRSVELEKTHSWKPVWNQLKVTWQQRVTRNGKTKIKNFHSHFHPIKNAY